GSPSSPAACCRCRSTSSWSQSSGKAPTCQSLASLPRPMMTASRQPPRAGSWARHSGRHRQHDENIPPWYKQFWPWFLISILVFAVVIGLGLLYVSMLNPDSMVRDNYYKEGRAINMHMG